MYNTLITIAIVLHNMFNAINVRADAQPVPSTCTYEMQVWNVNLRNSTDTRRVRHAYDELIAAEIDESTGCTVCSEDQMTLNMPPLPAFSVCSKLAPQVRSLMNDLIRKGAAVRTVVGYHVIKSRGPVNGNGERTGFSNHSYGTAIDINPEQNGLYENCVIFGPQCRLLRGGEWKPGVPGTLERNSEIVSLFRQAGFKWGGEIAGKQKDFMHFSKTGY
jgi:hypothetical protein